MLSSVFIASALFVGSSSAFDMSRSDNLAVYWGQDSYGAAGGAQSGWQQNIGTYCQDNVIDTIPIAFLNVFNSTGGLPSLNLANTCNPTDDPVFNGTQLPNCQFLASDIQACQAKGKIVTLSLGGASGAATLPSDAAGQAFAQTIWDLFLGGSSNTRPFGSAVLDGVDLDIEGGGSTGFAAFVTKLRSLASGASKKYYVTAAPQCPYPDAYLGPVINAVGFDAVYVQFYNNYCEVSQPSNFNFGDWDNWAKTVSPNKNVKIYIGAPASSTAAGNGYVPASSLISLATQTRSQYSSFGGVMLWDASQAYANGRYDQAVKNGIAQSGSGGGSSTTTSTTTTSTSTTTSTTTTTTSTTSTTSTSTTTSTTTTSTPSSGNCAGVAPWSSTVAYVGGSKVTYNGHLWQAKWWSQADVPGGPAGDWTDLGACTSLNGALGTSSAKQVSAAATPAMTEASKKTVETRSSETPEDKKRVSSRFWKE